MNREEAEKVVKETIEYANTEIKKSKRRYIKRFFIMCGIILLLILAYWGVFKCEKPLKYSKDIVEVTIPKDQGIDIKINLSNYKNAKALLVKTDENAYDLYINITQTLVTKIFNDSDKSNNLLRVGNSMIVDFQSASLRAFIPNGNNAESINHVYYIDNLSSKIMNMSDNQLINYSNKTLIWERK